MKIDSSTKIYGLIGYPVKHSLSAAMHNAAFECLDLDAEYRLFEVRPEELEDFLLKDVAVKDIDGNAVRAKDIAGFNVTIPHKVRAKEILEREFPCIEGAYQAQDLYYVKLSGAVNTVKRNGDVLEYWNTDAEGFCISLENDLQFDANGKSVLLFGCGGAGRAVIAALSWINIKVKHIYVYDANEEAVNSLKEHFSNEKLPQTWQETFEKKIEFIANNQISAKIKDCRLLVNATPIGMKEGDSSPIDTSLLHKDLSVYDVVYNRETELVKEAKALGLLAVNGLGMLLYQGVFAFEFWTGGTGPVEVMRAALEDALNKVYCGDLKK